MTTLGSRVENASTVSGFFGKFSVLRDAIPELWISFAIKAISIAAYGLTNSTLVLWMHSELGYRDDQALPIVAAWSLVMTAMTLLVGSLTDVLGMRRTLFIGTVLCILGRAVMILTTVRWVALACGLLPLAIGEALGGPVLIAAARCYSNTRQRSMSFSMIYAMMNLGFLMAGWLFDHFRKGLGEHGQLNLAGLHFSTYQTLFLVSLILEALVLPLIFLLREGAEATDQGLKLVPRKPAPANRSFLQSVNLTTRQATRETVQLFGTLLRQAGFHRLLIFLILIAFVKIIYRQMDYVYPTFGIRELGPGAPIGILWGLNSLFIIILAPIVGALTQRFSAYSMVITGGLISSASIFIMALPPALFVPVADGVLGNFVGHWYLGLHGAVHPYYVMISLFVLVLSVGEAFYSPRVYEYAAAIAPKGQEASYGALSYVPFLLAKLLIGLFSGKWLMRYCPETGPRHSETLWLIVALFSLVAPIGLIGLRRFIQVREAGRETES
ncbi:MFS transporter [Pedosphaera parvula]|uniref:Major facilitator superfamily MFS_1 n=1 Tax=Pedosphaera parvula (strain Ellin514) TaxID=320771 RepID=B9XLY0_PEDPL|nr:MFS transporter [Pedosphaera parvula]EEF59108.1 major facilitator superfamily MFS_1 [Pedosphaera parvula Ellin514]